MKRSHGKGFTLVELVIYIALASLIVSISVLSLNTLREAEARSESIAEVELQGAYIVDTVTNIVRSASTIVIPTAGSSGDTLTLNVITPGGDPTTISNQAGVLMLSVGGGTARSLTNSEVIVSDLQFIHTSPVGTSGGVVYSFTLSRVNESGLTQYRYSRVFNGTVALRN